MTHALLRPRGAWVTDNRYQLERTAAPAVVTGGERQLERTAAPRAFVGLALSESDSEATGAAVTGIRLQ